MFEINQTKIKGGCQSERKVVTHNSKGDLPLNQWKHQECLFASCDIIEIDTTGHIFIGLVLNEKKWRLEKFAFSYLVEKIELKL